MPCDVRLSADLDTSSWHVALPHKYLLNLACSRCVRNNHAAAADTAAAAAVISVVTVGATIIIGATIIVGAIRIVGAVRNIFTLPHAFQRSEHARGGANDHNAERGDDESCAEVRDGHRSPK